MSNEALINRILCLLGNCRDFLINSITLDNDLYNRIVDCSDCYCLVNEADNWEIPLKELTNRELLVVLSQVKQKLKKN